MRLRHLGSGVVVVWVAVFGTVAAAASGGHRADASVRQQTPARSSAVGAPDWPALTAEARSALVGYIRINTSNPPGSEALGAAYLAGILRRHGIVPTLIPIAPHRSAVYARLRGDGSRRALILLGHIDVVPADSRHWTMPPFGGDVKSGELYGRGTIDMKTLGIEELFALIALKQSQRPLHRDVIYLATPDEEAGGQLGAGWVVTHRPDLIRGAEFVLNEGGGIELHAGHPIVMIETTQKTPLWVHLKTVDRPSHGSVPGMRYSVLTLLDALDHLRELDLIPTVLPQVRGMFAALAPLQVDPELKRGFSEIDQAVKQPAFWQALRRDPSYGWYNSLLRSTIAFTRLQGSDKINVIPPEANAELDCRLLPTDTADVFLTRLQDAVATVGRVQFEKLLAFRPAVSSADTELYRAIAEISRQAYPGASVVESLSTGFTDSHYFRELGMSAYGWDAVELTEAEAQTPHGNDERVRLSAFDRALPVMFAVVVRVVR